MSNASATSVFTLLETWTSTPWQVPPQDFFIAQVDPDVLARSVEGAAALGAEPGVTGRFALRESGWSTWWAADLRGIREVGCFPDTDDPTDLAAEIGQLLRWRASPDPDDPSLRWRLRGHPIEVRVYGAERGRPVLTVTVERPTTAPSSGTTT